MSFFSILTLIFIVLKLTAVIDWSWWLVLAPTILHVFIYFIVILIVSLR